MVSIIKKYNINSKLKYEFFKCNNTIQDLICRKLHLIKIRETAQKKEQKRIINDKHNDIIFNIYEDY